MTVIEIILWILALMSFCLPWTWPLSFVVILNISDLIKRIRGKSIDDEIWLDRFNEKLDNFNEKIAVILIPLWPYLTFPLLTLLCVYHIATELVSYKIVISFIGATFFAFTGFCFLKEDIQFKKTYK